MSNTINNTVTNTGTIGSLAIGDNATAINSAGDVNQLLLESKYKELQQIIELHEEKAELLEVFTQAKALANSDEPMKSIPLWERFLQNGGSLASITSAIIAGIVSSPAC